MASVVALGYVGYEVSDSKRWDLMLHDIFGLQRRTDSKRVGKYRLDERHHRIAVFPAKQDKIRYFGWEAATFEDLEALAGQVEASGIKVKWGNNALRDERAVMDLIYFEGPDGFRTEIFYNALTDQQPFASPVGMTGFNTAELGLGHVVLFAKDKTHTVSWYEDVLGFKLSDYIYWDGEAEGTFMHCNARHHSLAIMNECFGAKGGDFGHLMIEVKSLDDVGRAYDRVKQHNFPVAMTLGRHTNDLTTSFYLYTPSGWWMEYGWGGQLIDDAVWEPKFYDKTMLWGHEILPPPPGEKKRVA